MNINVLHFSDLHFDDKNKSSILNLRDKMINSLKKESQIDIVIFSGDLTNRPSNQEFQNAYSEFISPVLIALNLTVDDCFFTPGNHDVEYSRRNKLIFSGLKDYVIKQNDKSTISSLISGETVLDEFSSYKEFIDSLNQKTAIEKHSLYTIYKKTINSITFGNIALNSSLFSEKSSADYGNLWIITDLLIELSKELDDCNIKTLNIHHSLSWYLNQREIKKVLLDKFNIVFYGHEHEHDGDYLMDLYNRDILSLHASSIYNQTNERNGYCIYSYNIDTNELKISKSEYNKRQSIFESFHESSIPNIDLLKKASKAIRNQYICSEIYPKLKEVINKYLAINLTSEMDKKDIESIYVNPYITYANNEDEKLAEIENDDIAEALSLQQIIELNKNILLEGKSESGKTSVLNMLNLTLLKHYSEQIPIYISGAELSNQSSIHIFTAKINDYLDKFYGNYKLNIQSMIEQKRFIFLIDDIQCINDEFVNEIVNLGNIIIATLTTKEYAEVEEKILHFNKKSNSYEIFDKLEIKPLRNRESKALTVNIVPSHLATKISNSVSKTITKLRLPSNPFITTLLIWMHMEKIEIKDNEPQIIDVFLDYLLEKSDLSKRFKGKFDFSDKKNLLCIIAEKFFTEKSLAIKEDKILESIIEYAKDYFAFPIESKDILEYFYTRRILVKSDGFVQFSYRVFYYYFIASHMMNNKDFYNSIISNKNYLLNMVDELRYYASIKRDDKEIIKVLKSLIETHRFTKKVNASLPKLHNDELESKETHALTELPDMDHDEPSLSHEDKELNHKIDTISTTAREHQVEKYNSNKSLTINPELRYREEYFILNMVLSEFIKNINSIKVNEQQENLSYSVSNYINIIRYWENILSNQHATNMFMSSNFQNDFSEMEEKELESLKRFILSHVLNMITHVASTTLSTPKMTKLYNMALDGSKDEYNSFLYLMLKLDSDDENTIIERIEMFISKTKNNNLFRILFLKLLIAYVSKDYLSNTKKSIKKILMQLIIKINNIQLDNIGVTMSQLNETLDEKIKIAKIIS